MPRADHVFQSPNFKKFANLYLKLGHCLGAFQVGNFERKRCWSVGRIPFQPDSFSQELNVINFNIVKEKLMRPDEEKNRCVYCFNDS